MGCGRHRIDHASRRTPRVQPIGCARLLADGHIGRVAVLFAIGAAARGNALLLCPIDEGTRGDVQVIVNAQVARSSPWGEKQRFDASGDVFEEAGIRHRVMTRHLP